MPVKDAETEIHEYPLATRGVNLFSSFNDIRPDEAIYTQNCIYKNGIIKRGGQSKFEADEVSTGKAIKGLHRFYYGASSKQWLVASGTTAKYHDGATWQNVRIGLTDNLQTHFCTWRGACYIANGTDQPSKWDGAANSSVAAAPADTVMFLPYQDRLLSLTGGDLTWSASISDATWETSANCKIRPDSKLFGMCHHGSSNQSAGYESMVLIAGANGMYLFKGANLATPFTTGDYALHPLATKVGCSSPRTMQWTPKGTIYLGIDKQVYLLPFNDITPIPIGHKIWGNTDVNNYTLRFALQGYIQNAAAVYHDGYYILTFTVTGTSNTVQWWLDVNRLSQDENGLFGSWYGPIVGQSISCFVSATGNGDAGELMGGEANAVTGSYVYQLAQSDIYNDDGAAIQIYYQTFFNPLGNLSLDKDVHNGEIEFHNVNGSITIDYMDADMVILNSSAVNTVGLIYWGEEYMDDEYWTDSNAVRQLIKITPAIQVRRLSCIIKNNSNTEDFKLYALRLKGTEQSLDFG